MRAFRRFISHCFWALLSLFITLIIILGAIYSYMEIHLPDVSVLNDVHMQVPLKIYSRDGKLISVYGTKRRAPVPLDQIPPLLIKAVLATEDARYYEHPGVDLISLVRAAKAVISSGRKVQGASTITMQVARNFFLTSKKTYSRKIKEILLALKIDKELSKDKVLELYLNKVYFGNRAYGVAAAAQVYYGKKLSQLTLAQMAMIAGLPQAPSRNNPLNNPKAALDRRNHVLTRMLEVGFIDKKAYETAVREPLSASYHQERIMVSAPYVAEMVRGVMYGEYGDRAYEMGLKVYTTIDSKLQKDANKSLKDGLIAYSKRHGFVKPKLNLGKPTPEVLENWQRHLEKLNKLKTIKPAAVLIVQAKEVEALLPSGSVISISWAGLAWARPALQHGWVGAAPQSANDIVKPGDVIWVMQNKEGTWELIQIPKVQGALVSLNPQDGAVLALTGGFNYRLSQFNRATQAERQPGSNFKPFIYSAALNKGFTLASIINDAPVVKRDTGENVLWRPQNDSQRFYGPTRLRVGLMKSRNLVSIRLLQAIGVKYTLQYVSRFGFSPAALPKSLSLALGSGVVTPLEIAVGYSAFANGGFRVTPYFIQKIVDGSGKVLYQANPLKACEICLVNNNVPSAQLPQPLAPEIISAQNAYLIDDALRSVIQFGTGRAARVLKRSDLSGKTGTTNNQVDAWFSGFNSNIETTVWVGFDNLDSLHEYGAQAALPIWIQFMRTALEGMPEATMPEPSGIVTVRIDPASGLLAAPTQQNAIFEIFRDNNAPTQTAHVTTPPPASATPAGGNHNDSSSGHLF